MGAAPIPARPEAEQRSDLAGSPTREVATADGDQLRLALAMRGGVSLAVWIGGAVAEIDQLRRSSLHADEVTRRVLPASAADPSQSAPPDLHEDAGAAGDHAHHVWSNLLAAAGFSRVLIDVMTGASAGGLNGVLYATALRSGRRIDPLRNVWLEQGAMVRLIGDDPPDGAGGLRRNLRRIGSAVLGPPAPGRSSILDGDYFTRALGAAVEELFVPDRETSYRQDHPLSLFLSGTIVGGSTVVADDDPWAKDQDTRSEAVFQFRHAGSGSGLSDFASPNDPEVLALAARTTASFPAAFEPVRWRPALGRGRLSGPPAFLAGNPELMDGGVVDNIPVGRAIGAIVGSPATTNSTRWLLYLQPSPGALGPPKPPADLDAPASSLTGVLTKLMKSGRKESVLDDLVELRQQNDQALLVAAARAAATTRGLSTVDPVGADPSTDAARLYRLLEQPGSELCWVPLRRNSPPSALDGVDVVMRQRIRDELVGRLRARYAASGRPPEVTVAPSLGDGSVRPFVPIIRTALLVIDWIIYATSRPAPIDPRTKRRINVLKGDAYRVLRLAELVESSLDSHSATTDPPRTDESVDDWLDACRVRAVRYRCDADLLALVSAAGLDPSEPAAAGPLGEALDRLIRGTFYPDPAYDADPATPPSGDDVLAVLWRRLVSIATDVAAALRSERAYTGSVPAGHWTIALTAAADDRASASILDRMDRATLGLHVGGSGRSSTEIRYTRVSGANVTPLALREFTCASSTQFSPPAPNLLEGPKRFAIVGDPPLMDSAEKLAGDQLANFTAFLSGRWRQNDWMWGQLDAAKSLLDVVLDPVRLVRLMKQNGQPPDEAADRLLGTVRGVVCDHPNAAVGDAAARLWAAHHSGVEEETRRLFEQEDTGPRSLELTKLVVLCRRHWDIFSTELPIVMSTPLRDDRPPKTPPPSEPFGPELLRKYQVMDKDVVSIWGRTWVSAIGVTAIGQLLASLTPAKREGVSWWQRHRYDVAVFPVRALVLALTGIVVAKYRALAALAVAVNVVVLPRLSVGWRCTLFVLVNGALLAAALWIRTKQGAGTASETSRERTWHLVGERLAMGLGALAALFGLLCCLDTRGLVSRHLYPGALRNAHGSLPVPLGYTVAVLLGAGLFVWLLWSWATWYHRLLAATVSAVVVWCSAWASLRHAADGAAHWWTHPIEWVGSLWWGFAAAGFLTVSWAVQRRPVSIAIRRVPAGSAAATPKAETPAT